MNPLLPNIPGIALDRLLGKGGFGEVWHGWKFKGNVPDSEVAVKLLTNYSDPQTLTRFSREIKLLQANLNNRFVVDILGFDQHSSPPYIVMEYCNQGSLRN